MKKHKIPTYGFIISNEEKLRRLIYAIYGAEYLEDLRIKKLCEFLISEFGLKGEVLIERFGFNYDKPHTLEEVAKKFNVTRERVRQIESNIIRRLRHPNMLAKLSFVLNPPYYLPKEYNPIQTIIKEKNRIDIPIKDCEFSVRTNNCLNDANIKTLPELLKHNAVSLLSIRNFGIKSLNEIRDLLKVMNLSLKDD